MPTTEIERVTLEPSGVRIATPPLRDFTRFEYRIVLEGVFEARSSYIDETFDALYRRGANGEWTERHRYLAWNPHAPEIVEEDLNRHRYVFRVPPTGNHDAHSVDVRVDLDRFVDQYLLQPSEVRAALGGRMTMTVLEIPLSASAATPRPSWAFLAGASLPAAVAVGGIGLILRRRMALRGLEPDIQNSLGRIAHKARAAARHGKPLLPLHARFAALQQGAHAVARQMQDLRSAQRLLDRRTLARETETLRRRLVPLAPGDAARTEAEATLSEKQKALARLDEMKQAEEVCALRLAKIEAVLDAACLTLRSARSTAQAAPSEETLCRELDAEVTALHEVERELAERRATQTQLLNHLGQRL